MSKKNIDHSVESRVCFEQLEEWVREQIQFYVQELLEDEVTQLLGRRKNERPRVRDLEERFESRVLPLSPSTVARLKQKWQGEMEAWQSRAGRSGSGVSVGGRRVHQSRAGEGEGRDPGSDRRFK